MNKKTIKIIEGNNNIRVTKKNMLIDPVYDLEDLDYWVNRLKMLKQEFVIAKFMRLSEEPNLEGKKYFEQVFSIFTDMTDENSAFIEPPLKKDLDDSEI